MIHYYGSYLRRGELGNEIRQYLSLDLGPWLVSDVISPKLGSPFGYPSREVCTPQYSFQPMFRQDNHGVRLEVVREFFGGAD